MMKSWGLWSLAFRRDCRKTASPPLPLQQKWSLLATWSHIHPSKSNINRAPWWKQRGAPPHTKSTVTISEFPPPETWRINYCSWKSTRYQVFYLSGISELKIPSYPSCYVSDNMTGLPPIYKALYWGWCLIPDSQSVLWLIHTASFKQQGELIKNLNFEIRIKRLKISFQPHRNWKLM